MVNWFNRSNDGELYPESINLPVEQIWDDIEEAGWDEYWSDIFLW